MKVILAVGKAKQQIAALTHPEVTNDVLISYWYCRGDREGLRTIARQIKARGGRLFIDSGVFTARKKGVDIPLREYLDFCLDMKDDCAYFFNLDLGDYDTQVENARVLVNAGVPTIPIINQRMSQDIIQRQIDISPYIGISYSAMGQSSGARDYEAYLNRLFEYFYKTNQKEVRTHALGLTKPSMMLTYPFYSCDSSTWVNPERFGAAYVFSKSGYLSTIPRKSASNGVKRFGVDAAKQWSISNDNPTSRLVASAKAFGDLEKFVTKVWQERNIVWKD